MRNEPASTLPSRDIRQRGSVATDVAEYVRELVLTGVLRPGVKVDQVAICEALDVSRSPVREALVILGQEGLLDLTPRRGARVARITPDDVIEHYSLFGVVSGRAAARAAEQLGDAELDDLARVHAEFERGTSLSPDALGELNDHFHRIINRQAPRRTRWLLQLLVRSVPTNYYEFADGWDARAVDHHADILDAIRSRDADRARRTMEHHLHESGLAAVEALDAQGFWD
jgi:DNA-binding GntR family transcriptional regulator